MDINIGDKFAVRKSCSFGNVGDIWIVDAIDEPIFEGFLPMYILKKIVPAGYATEYISCSPGTMNDCFDNIDDGSHDDDDDDVEYFVNSLDDCIEKRLDKIIRDANIDVDKVFDNCFVVKFTLPNGYEIVETYTNTDERDLVYDRVRDKVRELERYFQLQNRHDMLLAYDSSIFLR